MVCIDFAFFQSTRKSLPVLIAVQLFVRQTTSNQIWIRYSKQLLRICSDILSLMSTLNNCEAVWHAQREYSRRVAATLIVVALLSGWLSKWIPIRVVSGGVRLDAASLGKLSVSASRLWIDANHGWPLPKFIAHVHFPGL